MRDTRYAIRDTGYERGVDRGFHLVPTLLRGNAYLPLAVRYKATEAIGFVESIAIYAMIQADMHSHAGAWEREKIGFMTQ